MTAAIGEVIGRIGDDQEPRIIGPGDLATQADMIRLVGITYRQLDFWTRTGVLTANNPFAGSGSHRTWACEEIGVAQRIKQLLDCGFTLTRAAELARWKPATAEQVIDLLTVKAAA